MKLKLYFSFLLFLYSSFLAANEICSRHSNNSYSFEKKELLCEDVKDCWIGLIPPEDTFSLYIDGRLEIDLSQNNQYTRFNTFFIQLYNSPENLKIQIKDLNQKNNSPAKYCIEFGSYKNVFLRTSKKWLGSTGLTLFSTYFLILASIFLFFSLIIQRSTTGYALLAYCVISTFYLISFSEIPRLFFDPILFSGGIHFPLRLSQDLSLIIVFYHFYKAYDYSLFFKKIVYAYSSVLFCYLIMLIAGVRDYIFFERIIIYLAFLVAAPMTIGLYFAIKSKDQIERKILIPFFSILFLFQMNDLMCFWGIWNTYFTVKFYIPLIVSLNLFLYFRRIHNDTLSKGLLEEKQTVINRFVHDMKSPLSAIKVLVQDELHSSSEKSNFARSALDRIEEMANSLLASTLKTESFASIPLTSLIEQIVDEIKMLYPAVKIKKDFSNEIFVLTDYVSLSRVISNIIKNSIEAYETDVAIIEISIFESESIVKICIKDFGKGMSLDLVTKASKGGFTTKTEGKGVGLSSSVSQMKDLGGKLEVYSKEKSGTTIELIIPRGDVPFWYHTDNSMNDSIVEIPADTVLNNYLYQTPHLLKGVVYVGRYNFDKRFFSFLEENSFTIMRTSEREGKVHMTSDDVFVLIDDDKYVRKAWELNMRNKGRTIKTFETYESFFSVEKSFSRNSRLFLDRHIHGVDMIKSAEKITALGFLNVTIISFDQSSPIDYLGIKISLNKLPPD